MTIQMTTNEYMSLELIKETKYTGKLCRTKDISMGKGEIMSLKVMNEQIELNTNEVTITDWWFHNI